MDTRCRGYRPLLCRSQHNKHSAWGVRPQGWNSKELTGARTSSGVCGLIRSNAKNLTRAWHIQEYIRDSIALRSLYTGGAWLSSARVVRCWVKSRNERNPYPMLPASKVGDSGETAGDKSEEGGDDVKSSCPLCPGLHTYYNGYHREKRCSDVEQNSKK